MFVRQKRSEMRLNADHSSDNSFAAHVRQESYQYALEGAKLAGLGIGLTAGGGGNLPACIAALALCSMGGAFYGVICAVMHPLEPSESSNQNDMPARLDDKGIKITNTKVGFFYGNIYMVQAAVDNKSQRSIYRIQP